MVAILCRSGGTGGGIERAGFWRPEHRGRRVHGLTVWNRTTVTGFAGEVVLEQRQSAKRPAGGGVQLILPARSKLGRIIPAKDRKIAWL